MAVSRFMEQAATRDYSQHWQIEGTFPWLFQQPKPAIGKRPIGVRDNYERCVYGKQPYWMPAYFYESNMVWPDAIEEHPVPEVDGYDWWGVDWEMVENIQGMITRPGTRVINDLAHWEDDFSWPDLSLVDFAADGAKLQQAFDPDRPHIYECVEGITERPHEMMPFDEFLLGFVTEPEAMDRFFQKMADYKIECCKQVFEHYGRVDGVLYHDDWGTQRSGFYSNEMFDEQVKPATARLLKYIKDSGKFIELHSCGCNIQYVPEMLDMGIDMWTPQDNANDADRLYGEYGNDMTFCFPYEPAVDADEDRIRDEVRSFVDRFGGKGRAMCWIRTMDPAQDAIARDELYRYSLAYYNEKYGRG